jgi:hypothetical protein
MPSNRVGSALAALAAAFILVDASGCYHYTIDLRSAPEATLNAPVEHQATVTHEERAATFFNGFIGNGRINARKYCADPLRVGLRVTALDVVISMATLLVYTPHSLYVVCEAPPSPTGEYAVPPGAPR